MRVNSYAVYSYRGSSSKAFRCHQLIPQNTEKSSAGYKPQPRRAEPASYSSRSEKSFTIHYTMLPRRHFRIQGAPAC
ncbi:hypothetical protein M8J75_011481 [Diaphorina citri]|nr:hypothetical protein M8J75_011481 [Diaphorina citri]